MIREEGDVAIVGAGFAGSVLALVLRQAGLRPVLLERGTHPRFAIGESSTPLANLALEELGRTYDLPILVALSEYGRWQRASPQLACGLKRGFSYFAHEANRPFQPDAGHRNELLVAASPADEVADTHWFREQFDHFLASAAQAAGVAYLDRTEITRVERGERWCLHGRRADCSVEVTATFLVDATGPGGFLPRALGIDATSHGIHTHSWAVYTHFTDVDLWSDVLHEQGGTLDEHPFPCDAAALHHLVEEGWIWVLRFNNGITSAGIAFDGERCPPESSHDPAAEWATLLGKYPSIARQFRHARPVQPWVKTGRLQRRAARVAGPGWALLPHAAYFLDPFFSPGNAHALHGIQRLARIFIEQGTRASLAGALRGYEQALAGEVEMLDRMVHGCYRSFRHFDLFTGYSMYYFAAAITCEARRRAGVASAASDFLLSHDPDFPALLQAAYETVLALSRAESVSVDSVESFQARVARDIAPFNTAGLADRSRANMYPFV